MPIKYKRLHAIVIDLGFEVIEHDGTSHVKYRHKISKEMLILPNHPSEEIRSGLLDRILRQISLKCGKSKAWIKKKYGIKV